MAVEEYATVYQLVSVTAGTLDSSPTATTTKSGLNVLAASLPPGSMTGAPKKRSCALLTEIETQKPRGLYSGVLGFLDVGGGGDFSVVIRTAFRYGGADGGDDDDDGEGDWQIGAGGAVTVLSEAEAEWEEMLAKRESLLRVFGGA
jgi:para-aminobenzoate synthetase